MRLFDAYAPGAMTPSARALARSPLVSADMAHAVHPNYADIVDKLHRPLLGRGPVLKVKTSRYATDGPSGACFRAASGAP